MAVCFFVCCVARALCSHVAVVVRAFRLVLGRFPWRLGGFDLTVSSLLVFRVSFVAGMVPKIVGPGVVWVVERGARPLSFKKILWCWRGR